MPIYGGAPMGRQIDALAAGAQVVVGTPGRVLDHLHRGTLDPGQIRMLVLDEADEMLSMGFERELSSILERLPKSRQTLLFSATIPPDIERMAREISEIVKEPDVRQKFLDAGFLPVGGTTEQFAALMKKDSERYAEIIKQAHITVN